MKFLLSTSAKQQYVKVKKHREKGFSLVEFLAGSTITLTVVAVSFSLLSQGQTMVITQRAKTTAQARARKVMNLMSTDIRTAGCAPADITSGTTPGLLMATVSSIRIVSDRSGNGTTNQVTEDDANDDVTYSYSNKSVLRSAPNDPAYQNVPAVLANEIKSFTIRYYNSAGEELIPPTNGTLNAENRAKVTRVNLISVIEINEQGKETGTVTIDNPIALRNSILDAS